MILVAKVIRRNGGKNVIHDPRVFTNQGEAFDWWKKHMRETVPGTSDADLLYTWGDKCFVLGGDSSYTWTEI